MARCRAILYRDVDALGFVDLFDDSANFLYCQEQICDLVDAEVVEAWDYTLRAYQDVAGEKRLEVHDCEGEGSAVEDL